jgi:hypothetical protein
MSNGTIRENSPEPHKPCVFTSHRHADHEIANVIRTFLAQATANAVHIFQTSYEGNCHPEVGKLINRQLAKDLANSELVLLIYTLQDENWSYCMWECGVAFDPQNAGATRIIVLDAGGGAPAPLSNQVRVSLCDRASVKQFVRQLMTSENFFPQYGRAITGFNQDNPIIERVANDLIGELHRCICNEPDESWPAWPRILVGLPIENLNDIVESARDCRTSEAFDVIRKNSKIVDSDKFAAPLFGMPGFNRDHPLDLLITRWEERNPNTPSLWAKSLLDQLTAAVCWEFPQAKWALFKHANGSEWYAPMLIDVHKIPRKQCMRFDILFPRFDVNEIDGTIQF